MFKYILDPNKDYGILPIIPLIGFFLIFIGIVLWAIFAKKRYVDYMSKLPLEDQVSNKGGS
jgi:cbb3-type cytochrome oxidase subunit 3